MKLDTHFGIVHSIGVQVMNTASMSLLVSIPLTHQLLEKFPGLLTEPQYHYTLHIFIRSESMTPERLSNTSQYMEHHGYYLDSAKFVLFMQHDDTCHNNAGMFLYGNMQVMGVPQ
jgi:hypothetical protein